MSVASCSKSPLGLYLEKNGGHFHQDLEYRTGKANLLSFTAHRLNPHFLLFIDSFGTSIFSSTTIPPHTSVVSCPFALAVTPTLTRSALSTSFLNSEILNSLNDHELMCSYLSFHLVYTRTEASQLEGLDLEHWEYVESLPQEGEMRTPSYFSEQEMLLLVGTNLWGAAIDRINGWKSEWEGVKLKLKNEIAERFNW